MQGTDDSALLRQFLATRSEDAFTALVTRHINLVYSVALRHTGYAAHAEEITQAVFIILARKAAQLRHDKALSSWLFQTTRLTANNFVRSEMRRRHREQEAHMQSDLNEPATETWMQIAPLLDAAVASLNEKERRAVLMRFYEGRNFREIGAVLGASEDAAQKRLERAMGKLQKFFLKRGVSSAAAVISAAIAANAVHAAPASMTGAISGMAVAQGAAGSSTITLVNGALKLMAWSKAKTVVIVGVCLALVLAGGMTTVVARKHMKRKALMQNAYQRRNLADPQYKGLLADLRANVWPKERVEVEAKIKARQQRDETVNATTIDLRPYYNVKLTDSPVAPSNQSQNNLAGLPEGVNVYAGVPFDAEGVIQLDGKGLEVVHKHYPAAANAIIINHKCAKLHVLHAANFVYSRDTGTVAAKLILHYADGQTETIDMIAGEQVFDWWTPLFTTGIGTRFQQMAAGTEMAWTGSNPFVKHFYPDESLALFKSTFGNPRPESVIVKIDYVSTDTDIAPFMVALTVE